MDSKRFLSIIAATAIGLGAAIADNLTSTSASNATATSEQPQTSQTIYNEPEEKASFHGGDRALSEWLCDNLRYPEISLENDVQGEVIVRFVVERDGTVTNPIIVKGVDKDLDKEALRVVKTMPRWNPGKNNGKVVKSYYYFPIIFQLSQTQESTYQQ